MVVTIIIINSHLGNLTRLVISSKNGNATGVANLECHEKCDSFQGIIATIDVVSHEKVIGFRARSPDSKQLGQIVKLPMNVATNRHRSTNRLDIGLLLKNFLCL